MLSRGKTRARLNPMNPFILFTKHHLHSDSHNNSSDSHNKFKGNKDKDKDLKDSNKGKDDSHHLVENKHVKKRKLLNNRDSLRTLVEYSKPNKY